MKKQCLFCLSHHYKPRCGDPDCSGRLDTCPRHRATGGCAGCGTCNKKCFQAGACQRAKGDLARACSHCGATGHRKGLHCPKLKQEFLRDEVAGLDPADQERLWREENATTCAYCGEPGHTRRNCPVRRKDFIDTNCPSQPTADQERLWNEERGQKCRACGSPRHMAYQCTQILPPEARTVENMKEALRYAWPAVTEEHLDATSVQLSAAVDETLKEYDEEAAQWAQEETERMRREALANFKRAERELGPKEHAAADALRHEGLRQFHKEHMAQSEPQTETADLLADLQALSPDLETADDHLYKLRRLYRQIAKTNYLTSGLCVSASTAIYDCVPYSKTYTDRRILLFKLLAKIESTRAECSRLRLRDGFTLTQKIVTKAAALRKARRKVTDLEDELDDVTRELNGLELADELDAASLDIGNLAAKTHEAVSGDRNAIDKLMEELVKHKISRVNDYDRRAAEAKKACRMLDEIGTVSGQLDAMKLRVQQLEHRIALDRDASVVLVGHCAH